MVVKKRDKSTPSQRQLRVGEEMRRVVSDILRSMTFEEEMLRSISITVSQVKISPDLKNATVFVSPFGVEDKFDEKLFLKSLGACVPRLRKELGQKMYVRYVPMISFQLDKSFDYAADIDAALRSVRESGEDDGTA